MGKIIFNMAGAPIEDTVNFLFKKNYRWTEVDLIGPSICDAKSKCEGWSMKGGYTSQIARDGVKFLAMTATVTFPETRKAALKGNYLVGLGIETAPDQTELFVNARYGISITLGTSLGVPIDKMQTQFDISKPDAMKTLTATAMARVN